jgi:glucose 1-dehydrogenase
MIDLNGKVALITGSSRGIGRGCAIEMARAGADVTVNYLSHADDAEEVAESVRSLGRQAIVFRADVADRVGVDQMVAATVERFGHLDIVVCNAYYSKREPFLDMSVEGMRRTLDVSLFGAFHTAQAGARQLVAQGGGGSILFISSVLAFIPVPTALSYNVAKAGMNHMSAAIARELTQHHIRVNTIEPGWIDTPGERQFATEEEIVEGGAKLPWGRLGTIEDLGKAATFLSSDAADYITGAVLRVDGGFWLEH